MKLATWNVNSLRSRLDHVCDWLLANPIDALCLQETKVTDDLFPADRLESMGYHCQFVGQKSYNGVAIVSRKPLEQLSFGFAPVLGDVGNLDDQKRVITGVLDGVRILNLYVPNGSEVGSEKYAYKLRWLEALRSYLALQLKTESAIHVCGDFNIALEDRDIHDPKGKDKHIMSSPVERQALQDLMALGFADAFRKFNQAADQFSWWDYRTGAFPRNRGWRIDHHYLTPELYDRAVSCTIDRSPRELEKPSDHTPVLLELS
jgi:exodeoxyribonuclease III